MGEMLLKTRLSTAHTPWAISMSDELTKSTSQTKLIALLEMNKSQTISERSKDVIRKSYPTRKKCISFPDTTKNHQDLDTFTRMRAGEGSWEIHGGFPTSN